MTSRPPSEAGGPRVRPVSLQEILPMRQRVLRPHQRVDEVEFEGDRRPGALHLGAFDGGRLVGCASVLPDAAPGDRGSGAWRVRGMAVEDDARGRGIGARLLERCIEHARSHGGASVWCNARVRAVPFYERAGFVREGQVFDVDRVGPHVRMRRTL